MEELPDSRLVELAQGGDQQAFAELYNRWFDPVYDFVARMTRNRDEAADIAQDTFLKAMTALGSLQQGASFKSWLFTIARNTALNRLERAARTRPLVFEDEEGEEVAFDVVDADRLSNPAEAAEANAIAALVWEAAAGLDPKQLSLLDLHVRQGLDSGEIADVLGITKNNGYVVLNRLKKAVEDAIGAFIMWKAGRRYCETLDSLLASVEAGGMSPELRKLVERHVAQCSDCEERKKQLVSPLAVFGAFAAVGSPAGLKPQLLEGLLSQWPGPAAGGAGDGAAATTRAFPGSPPYEPWLAGRVLKVGVTLGAVATILGVLLFWPGSPVALMDSNGASDTIPASSESTPGGRQGLIAPSPTGTATAIRAGGVTGPAIPDASPSPGPTAAANVGADTPTATRAPATPTNTPASTSTSTATVTNTPTPVATPTPIPTATPTNTPVPPCNPTIYTNVPQGLTVPLGQSSALQVWNQEFRCGVGYAAAVTSGNWLSVAPPGGTIAPGGVTTLNVSVNASLVPAGEGTYIGTIHVSGPNNSFDVTVTTTRGGAAPNILPASVSGVCNSGAGTATFTAPATDDVAVTSVVVTFTKTGKGQVVTLALVSGSPASGTWSGSTSYSTAFDGTGFTVVATDGAGRTDSQLFTPKNCI